VLPRATEIGEHSTPRTGFCLGTYAGYSSLPNSLGIQNYQAGIPPGSILALAFLPTRGMADIEHFVDQ
jgi:hypothetical protein